MSGDFVDGDATDLSNIIIRSDAGDGAHTGVVAMPDGRIHLFSVIINPGYNGAYHINYNGQPLFIAYNTTPQNKGTNIYNIAGKRLRHPQKGINIVENKKVFNQ